MTLDQRGVRGRFSGVMWVCGVNMEATVKSYRKTQRKNGQARTSPLPLEEERHDRRKESGQKL